MGEWPQPDFPLPGVATYCGDALAVLRTLPAQSVQCCVTSPPYWGLRDYGTGTWVGGDPECDHVEARAPQKLAALADQYAPRVNPRNANRQDDAQINTSKFRDICGKCGARRVDQQLGLEATPAAYIAGLVAVFREVRRVLRDDGTLWVNMGDSYNRNTGAGFNWNAKRSKAELHTIRPRTLPPKNLVGLPWRLAFALQDDGWVLRQDIIWHKPNPMPESCRDRCTKAHEYVFLLSKSSRTRLWRCISSGAWCTTKPDLRDIVVRRAADGTVKVLRRWRGFDYYYDADAISEPAAYAGCPRGGSTKRYEQNAAGVDHKVYNRRNKRDVWSVLARPYKGAHYATFPPELIRPCVRAGCPAGGVVLDPFAGSGTVGQVALEEGRMAVLIELNRAYCTANIVPRLAATTRRLGLFAPAAAGAAEVL